MHKTLRFVVLFAALALATLPYRSASAQDPGMVTALRGFLNAVAAKDYASAWSAFSAKTKDLLVQSIAAGDKSLTAGEIRQMLDTNDERTQRGFWDNFRTAAKPEFIAGLAMTPAAAAGADGGVKVKRRVRK